MAADVNNSQKINVGLPPTTDSELKKMNSKEMGKALQSISTFAYLHTVKSYTNHTLHNAFDYALYYLAPTLSDKDGTPRY